MRCLNAFMTFASSPYIECLSYSIKQSNVRKRRST